jgi:hypothetical protein
MHAERDNTRETGVATAPKRLSDNELTLYGTQRGLRVRLPSGRFMQVRLKT